VTNEPVDEPIVPPDTTPTELAPPSPNLPVETEVVAVPAATEVVAVPAEPVAARPSTGLLRVLSIIVIVAGALMMIAGVITWFVVRDELADEKIVVSEDAPFLGGNDVNGPFSAYAEAEAINDHALEASGGLTYAELDREDPTRETVMTASFLRASLFTSVVAFGVAAFAFAAGTLLVLVGWALLRIERILRWARGPDLVAAA
jgi:hypothetical protein